MKKALKIIIPLVLAAAAITVLILLYRMNSRTFYNEDIVYGNTAGNFYNGGLFCELNGQVFFSNPEDENRLYQMTPDGREAKKITDDSVCFINADPHYIYYARDGHAKASDFSFLQFNPNSLCRISHKGGRSLVLDEAPALYVSLIQNDLYYIHYDTQSASTLYKAGIDGKKKEKVTNEPLLLSPGREGTLCYTGVASDHNISLWNPETDSGTTIYEGVCYLPIDTANDLYFLDAANDYHLMRLEKSSGNVAPVTDCRIDCYNLTDEYIYYQKNAGSDSALCRIRRDGFSEEEIVSPGNFTSINTTSRYVYFTSFKNPSLIFQTPANGPVEVESFQISYKK